jgi:transposase-like protein
LYVKVKVDGKACKKAVYAIIGIDAAGYKDVLGFWIKEAALFLRTCDLLKKWVKPVANWARVLNQLSVIFGNRITDFIN